MMMVMWARGIERMAKEYREIDQRPSGNCLDGTTRPLSLDILRLSRSSKDNTVFLPQRLLHLQSIFVINKPRVDRPKRFFHTYHQQLFSFPLK
jgi:hypothetical protein